ncbi:MAG: chloride channel protein [Leptolyngbyaceae bacterium]|nr:chloride channel protein [Leptolyngbyaceae bacterium]
MKTQDNVDKGLNQGLLSNGIESPSHSNLSQLDGSGNLDTVRQLTYYQLVMCAAAIGIFGGLVATAYYFVLESMMHGVWHTLREGVEPYFPSWLPAANYVWIATTVGGFCVGLVLYVFRLIGHLLEPLEHHRILLAMMGGLVIGAIAFFFPQTLFFSEEQIHTVIESGMTLGVTMLLLIAVAKMFAISFTLHSGFLGGFIFPLFFIGANVGLAISLAIPSIHPTLGMVCPLAWSV